MNAYMHITLPLVVHTINPWFPNLLTERKQKKNPKVCFAKMTHLTITSFEQYSALCFSHSIRPHRPCNGTAPPRGRAPYLENQTLIHCVSKSYWVHNKWQMNILCKGSAYVRWKNICSMYDKGQFHVK